MGSKLSGVIPAIPTPLKNNEDVDVDGLRKLLDYVIDRGAGGVFILGTMGEGCALVDSQKKLAAETAVKHAGGRVPLLAAITEISTRRVLEMGMMMQEIGYDYLVAATPFYYSFPAPQSIVDFVDVLTDKLIKPLVFYNVPARTGNSVDFETLDKIINNPKVAAMKNSSADMLLLMELLRKYPDKDNRPAAIFQGVEPLYDVSLLMGADGIVGGAGSLYVDILVRLYQAAADGNREQAFAIQKEFSGKLKELLGPELEIDWMYAIKKELKRRGICEDNVTSPFIRRI